jgi:hypothetical protein
MNPVTVFTAVTIAMKIFGLNVVGFNLRALEETLGTATEKIELHYSDADIAH